MPAGGKFAGKIAWPREKTRGINKLPTGSSPLPGPSFSLIINIFVTLSEIDSGSEEDPK